MRFARTLTAAALVSAATIATDPSAAAQSTDRALTPLEVAVACGPPPTLEVPAEPLRVAGAQDTVRRTIFNTADLLVIAGGTSKGVQIGQQYYVRRPIITGSDRAHPSGLLTLGWLSIVSANDTTALARLDHFCGGIFADDYLEPFVAPSIPPEYEREEPLGELNFGALSRVVSGVENQSSGAGGSLMLIDRGSDQDTRPGLRFAIYRDVRADRIPLSAVGEGIVLSVGKKLSLARVTKSRDAVITGDFIVPRK